MPYLDGMGIGHCQFFNKHRTVTPKSTTPHPYPRCLSLCFFSRMLGRLNLDRTALRMQAQTTLEKKNDLTMGELPGVQILTLQDDKLSNDDMFLSSCRDAAVQQNSVLDMIQIEYRSICLYLLIPGYVFEAETPVSISSRKRGTGSMYRGQISLQERLQQERQTLGQSNVSLQRSSR